MKRSAALFSFLLLAAQPAFGQSSLGFRVVEISTSAISGASTGSAKFAGIKSDFAITGNHGLQLDLDFADAGTAQIGTLAGHLYLMPKSGQKYGLFASYGDFNDNSGSVAQIGAEGIFELGSNLGLEIRTGMGVRSPGSMDYIFAGLGLSRQTGDAGWLSLNIDIADFEEVGFATTVIDTRIGYERRLRGTPATFTAQIGSVNLNGSGSGQGGTYVGIGLTFSLGQSASTSLASRLFTRYDPVTTLYRIGVF